MQSLLIVEDDRAARSALVRELGKIPDAEIHEASSGGEALRLLGARPFDLIVLDLHMPLIDGFMVLRALRAKPGPNERTPIYVVTADLTDQTRARAMELGVAFFMTKPVAFTTLVAVVSGRLKQAARGAEADTKAARGRAKASGA